MRDRPRVGRELTGFMRQRPPDPQYLEFLGSYSPAVRELALAARKLILQEAPEVGEFVYQVYTIADHFSFTERPSDAFVYTSTHASWVNLGFNFGAVLPDPKSLLQGEGKRMRHVRIAKVADLEAPGVRELLRAAISQAERPEAGTGKPRTIVHATAAARKPAARRPPARARG